MDYRALQAQSRRAQGARDTQGRWLGFLRPRCDVHQVIWLHLGPCDDEPSCDFVRVLLNMIHKKIEDPWRSRLVDLVGALGTSDFMVRFSGLCLLQGKVVSLEGNIVKLHPHLFRPGLGFVEMPHEFWDIHVPHLSSRAIRVCEGDSFTFFGRIESESGSVFHLAEEVCVIPASKWDWESPVNSFHLFSGSFGGWSQAIESICEDASFPPLGQQVCIDSDPVTLDLWSQTGWQASPSGKDFFLPSVESEQSCGNLHLCW